MAKTKWMLIIIFILVISTFISTATNISAAEIEQQNKHKKNRTASVLCTATVTKNGIKGACNVVISKAHLARHYDAFHQYFTSSTYSYQIAVNNQWVVPRSKIARRQKTIKKATVAANDAFWKQFEPKKKKRKLNKPIATVSSINNGNREGKFYCKMLF